MQKFCVHALTEIFKSYLGLRANFEAFRTMDEANARAELGEESEILTQNSSQIKACKILPLGSGKCATCAAPTSAAEGFAHRLFAAA